MTTHEHEHETAMPSGSKLEPFLSLSQHASGAPCTDALNARRRGNVAEKETCVSLDLPPMPPPPTPRPALGRGATIALGCGAAVGVAAFLALVAFILAVAVLPARTVPKGRIFVDGIYAKAEGNKNLTKDDLAVYKEIADLIASPESSVFAVNVGGAILYDHLKDGAVSSVEIAAATAVRADVEKNLQGGAFALATYVKEHPEMQEAITEFTRAMALARVRVP